ncbi:hypothetical protein RB195_009164 [Necator americanus]|uniref:Uncharacterized protein n=1 Tax=Necator americanus TaxID=51031 RepID=A0ABR1CS23_NECAM
MARLFLVGFARANRGERIIVSYASDYLILHKIIKLVKEINFQKSMMRSSRRGTFPSRTTTYQDHSIEFFPRGPNDVRRPRDVPGVYSSSGTDEAYSRSRRDLEFERRSDFQNSSRIASDFSQNDERRGSSYLPRERGGPLYDGRNYAPTLSSLSYSVSADNRVPTRESDSRYKYLSEGWYNDYKTTASSSSTSLPQGISYGSRDYRDSRNGYNDQAPVRESERIRAEKSSHLAVGPSPTISKYGYLNASIARETRELQQRMAAIQRELDMLEKEKKKGSRSPEYQRDRNDARRERRVRREPHSSSHSSSTNPPPRRDAAEQARLERERENLRRRERELARREEELLRKERRLRERTPPRSVRPAMSQPRRGTLFKGRRFISHPRLPVRAKRVERILSNLEVRLPEKRRAVRTKDVPVKKESRPSLKRRIETKREHKEEQDVTRNKAAGNEEAKNLSQQAVAKMLDKAIGPEELDNYETPRQRALAQLLSHCDRKLLTGEVLKKFGIMENESEQTDKDSYKKRICVRTHNPTTFGSLDQFVPLRSFEEEVVVEPPNMENEEVFENLKTALGFSSS